MTEFNADSAHCKIKKKKKTIKRGKKTKEIKRGKLTLTNF